ncbi:ABC transporter permease subunit [Thiohalobacter sp. IOR34]|uniref:ABC transporter permease subunit n=1 Tax=Thiohalobacter sp. IOR34 TaxID=3057176 RepID=UPI0025B0B528|nr:ABC transporter permease subunit [Thiohalobacter sp. IOR34]WJW75757.1 ABC transporter permease subunit [Thiohalobacter sp. IOR34]
MILHIAARELRSLFLSPLAWSILAVVQFILAYLFLAQLDTYMQLAPRLAALEDAPGVTDVVIAPLLGNTAVVLLLVAPLITMRVLSEERRSRTLGLLLSAPVSMTEIVLGKYLGLLGFFFLLLALVAAMSLSLLAGTSLDLGKLFSGLLGLALLLGAFAAAGLFMSSLTDQPTIAAISSFGLLLLLWIIDWAGNSGTEVSGVFAYLSLLRHYESLLKGLFDSTDVLYYLLFILAFLVLSVQRLDAQRLPH